MTEEKWLTPGGSAVGMMFFLGHTKRLTPRKTRLFAVACCRAIEQFMVDERSRQAVAVAERLADGLAAPAECAAAAQAAFDARDGLLSGRTTGGRSAVASAAFAAGYVLSDDETTPYWAALQASCAAAAGEARLVEAHDQILRELFGNPYRPVDLAAETRHHAAVTRLAEAIYQDRAFDRLPILADALEEAGCRDEAILAHCREPGEHARGCWVLDLLTARK